MHKKAKQWVNQISAEEENKRRFVFLDVLSFSINCDIGIGLFKSQFDVIFVISRFTLAVLRSYGGHVLFVDPVK